MNAAGGSVIDCLDFAAERVRTLFSDLSETEFNAPRLPDLDGGVKALQVFEGWPPTDDRKTSVLPFIAVRPVSLSRVEGKRQVQIQISAVNACETSDDFAWAWILLEQIERDFAEYPWLAGGLYQILADSWDVREGLDIRETWGWNAVVATVNITMPAFEQIYGPDGKRLRWEDEYA